MTFTVNTTLILPEPHAAPDAEIIGQQGADPIGTYKLCLAANTLFWHKKHAVVNDGYPSMLVGAGGRTLKYRCKMPVGKLSSATAYRFECWLYVVRDVAYPTVDWQVTFTNTTAGASVTAQVNAGAITTGTWWRLGYLNVDDDNALGYNDIEVTVPVGTGLPRAGCVVRAVAMYPDTSGGSLPSQAGGYINSGGGTRVIPLENGYYGVDQRYVSSHVYRFTTTMLVDIWQRAAAGNFLNSSAYNMGTGGGTASIALAFPLQAAPGVTEANLMLRNNEAAKADVDIYLDAVTDNAIVASGSINASTTGTFTFDVPPGLHTLFVMSTRQLYQASGWWTTPPYPAA